MAATSSSPLPALSTRVVLQQSATHPKWNVNIYGAHFEIENLDNIEANKMIKSEEVKVGPDGLRIGVNISESIAGDIGVYLYKVNHSS